MIVRNNVALWLTITCDIFFFVMMCVSIVVNEDKDVGYRSCCDDDGLLICFGGGVVFGIFWVIFSVEPVCLLCGLCLW